MGRVISGHQMPTEPHPCHNMNTLFWLRRFLINFLIASGLLLVVNLAKGKALREAAGESLVWGGIAAAIFTSTGIFRARRGDPCRLCGIPPQGQNKTGTESSGQHD